MKDHTIFYRLAVIISMSIMVAQAITIFIQRQTIKNWYHAASLWETSAREMHETAKQAIDEGNRAKNLAERAIKDMEKLNIELLEARVEHEADKVTIISLREELAKVSGPTAQQQALRMTPAERAVIYWPGLNIVHQQDIVPSPPGHMEIDDDVNRLDEHAKQQLEAREGAIQNQIDYLTSTRP